jgi:hypothetical protein
MATVDETDAKKKEKIDGDGTHKKCRYDFTLTSPSSYYR